MTDLRTELERVLAPLELMMGKRTFTVTRSDDGSSSIEGPHDFMVTLAACLDVLVTHGRALAGVVDECVALRNERDHAERELAKARPYMDNTFDSYAVFSALAEEAKRRTGPENVTDTLDALHRVAKQHTARDGGGEG